MAASVNHELKVFFDKSKKRAQKKGAGRELVDAIADLTLRGGKRLRPALGYTAYTAVKKPDDKEDLIRALISLEILHTYLLVHDDIMDDSDVRRGGPSLHISLGSEFGDREMSRSLAILAGDLGSAFCLMPLIESDHPPDQKMAAVREFLKSHELVVLGQEMDLRGKGPADRIMYLKTASYSTAGPVRTGAALAGASPEVLDGLESWAVPAGLAFQLRDDVLGLFGEEEKTGKPAGDDLMEKKRTYLIEVFEQLASPGQKAAVDRVYGKRTVSKEDLDTALDAIRSSGALKEAEDRISGYVKQSITALEKVSISANGRKLFSQASELLGYRNL